MGRAPNSAGRVIRNVVGPQVRRHRYRRGMTQEEFAGQLQLAGLNWGRVELAKVEARIRQVGDAELYVLARTLVVALEDLYPGREAVRDFLAVPDAPG